MTIDSLKDQARRHERDEDWQKALDLYLKAIDRLDGVDEPDVSIFNRAADLHVRLGKLDGALEFYERAIDLYLEADLPNNAIAICRKMIRHVPDRVETFRRMGQIRALQGFAVDARQNYLTYAEILHTRGQGDEALAALEELVQRIPSDWETRILLAEGFLKQDRMDDALTQLHAAWDHLAREGADEERAEALKERILELDPDRVLEPSEAQGEEGAWAEAGTRGGEVPGFEATGLEALAGFGDEAPSPTEPEPAAEEPEPVFDEWPSQLEGHPGDDLPAEAPPPAEAGEEPGDVAAGLAFQEILEEPGTGREGELAAGAGPEPELEGGVEPAAYGELDPFLEPMDATGEAGLDFDGEEAALEEDDLPFLEVPEPDSSEESSADLEYLHDFPGDGVEEEGDLPFLHVEKDADGDEVAERRREVEAAFRSEDRDRLITALGALGQALSDAGSPEAETIFGQLLQLDPGNPGALAALGRAGPFDGPLAEHAQEEDLVEMEGDGWADGPGDGEAPAETRGYVDLGSMILDDSLGEKTTRWTVAAEEPSGDDAADFARMLSQFKEKVAQNLEGEDARSQYDLGTAYKEMGLVDEAISMFQKALRMEPGHLAAIEMMGQCFLDRDEPFVAIRVLDRGVARGSEAEDDLVGIYYFLGQAHESAGNPGKAREFYEKVFALDINFRDVTDRLRALR
jgi:tetratricopeptide (TPR) repeat protein